MNILDYFQELQMYEYRERSLFYKEQPPLTLMGMELFSDFSSLNNRRHTRFRLLILYIPKLYHKIFTKTLLLICVFLHYYVMSF